MATPGRGGDIILNPVQIVSAGKNNFLFTGSLFWENASFYLIQN